MLRKTVFLYVSKNECGKNENVKVRMCDMTRVDRIKNECLTRSSGVTDIAGKMRENKFINGLDM